MKSDIKDQSPPTKLGFVHFRAFHVSHIRAPCSRNDRRRRRAIDEHRPMTNGLRGAGLGAPTHQMLKHLHWPFTLASSSSSNVLFLCHWPVCLGVFFGLLPAGRTSQVECRWHEYRRPRRSRSSVTSQPRRWWPLCRRRRCRRPLSCFRRRPFSGRRQ